ncbi:MAG TPA: hypothetical protein VEN78_32030 [Bradyrhizobium sp.]|nr:hypothetical protein [Bradyrhizobium sp.]
MSTIATWGSGAGGGATASPDRITSTAAIPPAPKANVSTAICARLIRSLRSELPEWIKETSMHG